MNCDQMLEKMTFVMWRDDLCRINIEEGNRGEIKITVDLHGYTLQEAKRIINNIIAIYRVSFTLVIIHGYNHGTAIKEYIWNDMKNRYVTEKRSYVNNLGVTLLSIEK